MVCCHDQTKTVGRLYVMREHMGCWARDGDNRLQPPPGFLRSDGALDFRETEHATAARTRMNAALVVVPSVRTPRGNLRDRLHDHQVVREQHARHKKTRRPHEGATAFFARWTGMPSGLHRSALFGLPAGCP